MKNVAAFLLLGLGGNEAPTKDDISRVIKAGGGEVEGLFVIIVLFTTYNYEIQE